jgi:hypothetical protein
MFSIVPNLISRLKALLLTFVVAELEADLIAAAAERKAELLRQANQFEQDNLPSVAEQLRRQTESIAPDKPLASVAATIADLQTDQALSKPADANATLPPSASQATESLPPSSKKKKA